MSVPLDRLYNHIDSLCDHDVIIYRFFPHGSKKLSDLSMLRNQTWFDTMTCPLVICHDQEPLNYYMYSSGDVAQIVEKYNLPKPILNVVTQSHLRGVTTAALGVYDRAIVVHSEQRSSEVDQYENNGFATVYWWSHAVIARDWFRYAEHDPELNAWSESPKHDFLIYNRAWSGSREYRLKFAELLVQNKLVKHCDTKFSSTDNDQHYTQHVFRNEQFKIQTALENYLAPNHHDSAASADYHGPDYQAAGIEVVLETLFDDTRWHLTEKTLRPIAVGKPFILMATPGSLQYLKQYGFETFSTVINESYDTVADPMQRMAAVINELKRIANLNSDAKARLYQQLNSIAARNKQYFFSADFQNKIFAELKTNLNSKINYLKEDCVGAKYWRSVNPAGTATVFGAKTAGPGELQQFNQWLAARGL